MLHDFGIGPIEHNLQCNLVEVWAFTEYTVTKEINVYLHEDLGVRRALALKRGHSAGCGP